VALRRGQLKASTCYYLIYFMDRNDTDVREIENQAGRGNHFWLISSLAPSKCKHTSSVTFAHYIPHALKGLGHAVNVLGNFV